MSRPDFGLAARLRRRARHRRRVSPERSARPGHDAGDRVTRGPQELGDFGVLVYGGFERRRALVLNYPTRASVVLGGVAGYVLDDVVTGLPTVLLPFAAGNFIDIASSDPTPEIKHETDVRRSSLYFLAFLVGIGFMLAIRLLPGTTE
ncbi:ZIP family metal transporter [Halorarum salinum]|uniref:ZIP family metal transporter n=1 Tax=Halorarum salinum TaxID=2743089 RepID=UPI001C52A903